MKLIYDEQGRLSEILGTGEKMDRLKKVKLKSLTIT